jgi:hypothetical protein
VRAGVDIHGVLGSAELDLAVTLPEISIAQVLFSTLDSSFELLQKSTHLSFIFRVTSYSFSYVPEMVNKRKEKGA